MKRLTNDLIDDTEEYIAMSTVHNAKIFNKESENFRRALSKQILDSVPTWNKDLLEIQQARLGALEAWQAHEPGDASEALLVAQMLALHNSAIDLMTRAAFALSDDEAERCRKEAIMLMDQFGRQLTVLNKHRGKGQQKITVERVTVERGGQAIVGNVQAPALAAATSSQLPPPAVTIDHGPIGSPRTGVRSRTRRAND